MDSVGKGEGVRMGTVVVRITQRTYLRCIVGCTALLGELHEKTAQ